MFVLNIHKKAQKAFEKAPLKIKKKVAICLNHLQQKGLLNLPYPIRVLKNWSRKHKYFEIKIDKDYRIVFRLEGNIFYIRLAGTHNALGTG